MVQGSAGLYNLPGMCEHGYALLVSTSKDRTFARKRFGKRRCVSAWLRCQVTRHVFDEQQGKSVAKADVLEVPVKAGWKPGTKITYTGECAPAAGMACCS